MSSSTKVQNLRRIRSKMVLTKQSFNKQEEANEILGLFLKLSQADRIKMLGELKMVSPDSSGSNEMEVKL